MSTWTVNNKLSFYTDRMKVEDYDIIYSYDPVTETFHFYYGDNTEEVSGLDFSVRYSLIFPLAFVPVEDSSPSFGHAQEFIFTKADAALAPTVRPGNLLIRRFIEHYIIPVIQRQQKL